ncbi:tetratricopeptide repeat protein [Streptomyces virginiae]|uniref:tetratricopeptide repeat protein n=1 Tax=Streptomyces virginiae TaxID=1961 RepID=UPI003661617D
MQRAPQEPAAWPHQVGVIPSRARSLQYRAEADRLRSAVEGGGTAVLWQVLTGMGGVGKTQLAAEYARAAWDDGGLDVLVWATASSQSPVISGYAQAGVELCGADPDDPEQAARKFLAWLAPKAGQRPCRWLIVLDDVTDPNDLVVHPEEPGTRFSLWPPAGPHGRTLLTTRRRDAALFGEGRRRIEVGLFTPAESLAYLTASLAARDRTEPSGQLTALAHDLGHLPLALAQAAAYLIDSGETAATYRGLLADRATKLTDIAPDALPDEQPVALAAAWSLSIDRADTLRPDGLARPMLHLAALLDANGIPQDVLTSEPARTHLAAHRTTPGTHSAEPAPIAPADAARALRALDRLSLIDHTPTTPHQAVRVHQLIQRTTRDTLTPHQHDHIARTAADALMAAWPTIERDTDLAQALRANTRALNLHVESALHLPEIHPVLHRLGRSLSESGQLTAAIDHFQNLENTAAGRLGPDHLDLLTMRANLANWRGEAGDAAGAVQALADVVESMTRVLGPDHLNTLITRANLADWRGEAGDAAGAVQALADVVESMTRVLGPDHPSTLIARSDFISWRGKERATTAAAQVEGLQVLVGRLADRTRVLGPDHPYTVAARRDLASWRGRTGAADEAVLSFSELLADQRRALGPDHPETLSTRNNLAFWRGEAGDFAGAAQTFADLVESMTRVLGPDHPNTLTARRNLAYWQGEAGDAAGAVQALADVVESMTRVLGPDHLDTLMVRNSLASWLGRAGDPAGAVTVAEQLLEHMVRVLGEEQLHVQIVRRTLDHWQKEVERTLHTSGEDATSPR